LQQAETAANKAKAYRESIKEFYVFFQNKSFRPQNMSIYFWYNRGDKGK